MSPRRITRSAEYPRDTRAMFQRVLSAWIIDTVELGRRGLSRPSVRFGAALIEWIRPGPAVGVATDPVRRRPHAPRR